MSGRNLKTKYRQLELNKKIFGKSPVPQPLKEFQKITQQDRLGDDGGAYGDMPVPGQEDDFRPPAPTSGDPRDRVDFSF